MLTVFFGLVNLTILSVDLKILKIISIPHNFNKDISNHSVNRFIDIL